MSAPRAKRRYRLATLFSRIGELTVTWAFVEFAVDLCISEIHENWGGTDVEPDKPRTAFNRKITYLRAWYKARHNAVLFPQFDLTIDMLELANEHRQNFIHGMHESILTFPTSGAATLLRTLHKGRHAWVRTTYSLADMRLLRRHMLALAIFMGSFWEILRNDPVLANEADESLSKLFVEIGGFFPVPERRRHTARK
jgi:hypothetical protein